MKYLKKFNESDQFEDSINDIKDIFQEYIDDYDMYAAGSDGNEWSLPGLRYRIDDKFPNVSLWVCSAVDSIYHEKFLNFIKNDLNNFIKRLGRLGYVVNIPDSKKIDPKGGAKYLLFVNLIISQKGINESNESDGDLTQVLIDVFQDVIDDYGFYREFDHDEDSTGLLYHTSNYKPGRFFVDGRLDYAQNVGVISFYYSYDGICEYSSIVKSIDFLPYIKRLKDMGYEVISNLTHDRFVKIEIYEKPDSKTFENSDESQYHIDIIKDAFQEVIDEYDLHKSSQSAYNDDYGYGYILKKSGIGIYLEVSASFGFKGKKLDFHSDVFKNFFARLRSMKYYIRPFLYNSDASGNTWLRVEISIDDI